MSELNEQEDWFDRLEHERAIDTSRTNSASSACESVTRVVVAQDNVYTEYWADSWRVLVQDGGRTVKLFATGKGEDAASTRAAELERLLGLLSS